MDKDWTVALTLVRRSVPPANAVWLLLANNPLLLGCTVFWADRVWHRLCWLARWAKWLGAVVQTWHYASPDLPTPPGPPRPRRLCPNGDHTNIEETRIVVGEHFRRILGTLLLAAFLSWLVAPSPSPSPVLPAGPPQIETNLLPDPWADSFVSTETDVHADVDVDPHIDDTTDGGAGETLPPRYYRRPPSQFADGTNPRVRIQRDVRGGDVRDVVVSRSSAPSTPSTSQAGLPPIGASGFTAARKAARATQNAAADQWVLALRQRLVEESREDGGKSVGHLHTDNHDELALARSASGLGCTACSDGRPGIDVDTLFSDVVRRRDGYGQENDQYALNNPHDRPDDAPW